ncbi:MAG TPA: CPBP family intramembrane glutamic endopeptidase [Acidimicrobiales bacterium]|nr:CPBP family intramembrane glutamic endopeptidase [Acidimicrobiales bacterium]
MTSPLRWRAPSGGRGGRDGPVAAGGEERPPLRWGITYSVAGLIAGILLSSLAAGAWLAATGESDLPLGGLALSQIGLWIGLAGAAVCASRVHGTGRVGVDLGLWMRPLDPVVGVVVGVAAQVGLVNLIAILLSPLVGHPDVSQEATDLVGKTHGVGLVGLIVFVVIGAPIVEELFFRGLFLRSLQRRLPDWAAITLSGLLFGLAHLQDASAGGLILFVSLFAFGVVLAVAAVRSGRLGPGIWAHATFNAFTVAVLLLT